MKILLKILLPLLIGLGTLLVLSSPRGDVAPDEGVEHNAAVRRPVKTTAAPQAPAARLVSDTLQGEEGAAEIQDVLARLEGQSAESKRVTGRVLGAGGQPVAGAEVHLLSLLRGALEVAATVRSDAAGRFVLAAPQRAFADTAIGVRVEHLAPAVAGLQEEEIVLTRAASIVGRVVDEGGSPLAGARVRYRVADGRGHAGVLEAWLASAVADRSGFFALSSAPQGAFALEIEPAGGARRPHPAA